MLANLPTDKISLRSDARTVSPEAVAALEASIAEVGLINPIRVRVAGDGWEVIAGAHRLAATKNLGLAEIEAIVYAADDIDAELAMIDENLCRSELTASERAQATARRKTLYEQKHPETKHGGDRKSDQVANSATRSFADETAAISGQSARTVRQDAERGEKVYEGAFSLIKNTPLDTGTFLDKLKKLTPSEQMVVAKRELAYLKQQQRESAKKGIARRVRVVEEPLSDEEAIDKQFAAIVSAWDRAGPEARQRFKDYLDVPVFDRSAA